MSDIGFLSFEHSGDEAGTLQEITVFSAALGRRADISIYATSTAALKSLPLVVLLHGVYGSHWSWSRRGHAHEVAEALVREGTIGDCVLAMPSDGLFGLGSGYVANGREDARRWVTREVPAAVRALYPQAGLRGMAIAGLSMGGLGALSLISDHPDDYCAAAALSPLLDAADVGQFTGYPEYGPPVDSITTAGVVAGLTALNGPTGRLWLGCGLEDPILASSRTFHARLKEAGVGHTYVEAHGEHEWSYWTSQLGQILVFFDSLYS